MIKASEIRIGNAIWDDTRKQIKWVNHRVISDLASHANPLPYSPIPLTPEWLVRCGFQFLDSIINGRYYVRWANSPSEIAWYPVGEYISINTSTGGEGDQPNYTELHLPHIKYVHQLQNIYFDHTGHELEIKL